MTDNDDIPKRTTPGINVANVLDRLRFETNKAQKNAIIDRAIEQVRKDYKTIDSMRKAFFELVVWCRWNTSPTDENSPHDLLVKAVVVLEAVGKGE